MPKEKLVKISDSFFVDADYQQTFADMGLTSIEAIFSFEGGQTLSKKELSHYRTRIRFETDSPSAVLFLKRYDRPPLLTQLRNWLTQRRRISFGHCDCKTAEKLLKTGINTPKTIAKGQQWDRLFERRSFSVTEKINGQSLEKKLPECFENVRTSENRKLKKTFIEQLARFIRKFHETGYRHRDLYFSHIFYNSGKFYLIDLARVFKPVLLTDRFRVKDIAQLYYSAPAGSFYSTDRIRFYHCYTGRDKLTLKDKIFIGRIKRKAKKMARRDTKRGKTVPFMC